MSNKIINTELKINHLIKELEEKTGVHVLVLTIHDEGQPRVKLIGSISRQEIHPNTMNELTDDLEICI